LGKVVWVTGMILGPFGVTTYWYFAQAFLGAMKRVAGRTEDGEEQGKRGIVRKITFRRMARRLIPITGPPPPAAETDALARNNSTQVGIPRPPSLTVDPHPTLGWPQNGYPRNSLVRLRTSGNSTGPHPLSSRPGAPGLTADSILITVTGRRTILSAHR